MNKFRNRSTALNQALTVLCRRKRKKDASSVLKAHKHDLGYIILTPLLNSVYCALTGCNTLDKNV